MTSWEERVELEQGVCEAERDRDFNKIVLEQKEIALRYALEKRDDTRANVQYHNRNRLYAKNKADIVDIKEYRGILKQLKDAREKYEDAIVEVHQLSTAADHYSELVQSSEHRISASREVLDSYGKVLPFRSES